MSADVNGNAGAAVEVRAPKLESVRDADPITLASRYRMAVELLDPRVFDLEPGDLDRPWDEAEGLGSWSIRALLCHLADAEMVFTWRMRRALVEDSPVLTDWDHGVYLDSPLYAKAPRDGSMKGTVFTPVGALAATVHTLRQWTASQLFQIDREDWSRRCMHPDRGEMTVFDIVALTTWHFEHHVAFCNAKVERLLGPRPAPGQDESCGGPGAAGGGCGAGCGCVGG